MSTLLFVMALRSCIISYRLVETNFSQISTIQAFSYKKMHFIVLQIVNMLTLKRRTGASETKIPIRNYMFPSIFIRAAQSVFL